MVRNFILGVVIFSATCLADVEYQDKAIASRQELQELIQQENALEEANQLGMNFAALAQMHKANLLESMQKLSDYHEALKNSVQSSSAREDFEKQLTHCCALVESVRDTQQHFLGFIQDVRALGINIDSYFVTSCAECGADVEHADAMLRGFIVEMLSFFNNDEESESDFEDTSDDSEDRDEDSVDDTTTRKSGPEGHLSDTTQESQKRTRRD